MTHELSCVDLDGQRASDEYLTGVIEPSDEHTTRIPEYPINVQPMYSSDPQTFDEGARVSKE